MSDIVTDQTADQEIDPVVVDTSETETGTVEEAQAEAERLDFEAYGKHVVPVKINGEESYVPLAELQQGYQRQQDYTLKTQEVAAQREELAQAIALREAFDEDPQGTLKILAAVYGDEATSADEEDLDLDPMEKRLRDIEARFQAEEQATQEAEVLRELDGLHERYGVDQQELLKFAVDENIQNLGHAYAVMAQTKLEAENEFKAAEQAKDDGRTADKRGASFIAGGTTNNPSSSSVPESGHQTIQEAYAAAKLTLGL